MSINYNEGIVNSAYHQSETLEMDRGEQRRPSSKKKSSFHHNPYSEDDDGDYADEIQGRRGDPEAFQMSSMQPEFDYNQLIPKYSTSKNESYREGYINPNFQHEPDPRLSYLNYDHERSIHINSPDDISEGGQNVRRRNRKQSALPMALLSSSIVRLDPSVAGEMEYKYKEAENEKFIEKLVGMSAGDISEEIQKLPLILKEKRDIRNKVILMKQKSLNDVSRMNCCTDCLRTMDLSFRRSKQFTSDFFQGLQLWHKTLKVIGGNFGTSILSYFIFLKWLLTFNIFSFMVNFSFITIPQFIDMDPNNLSFTGLELLTGAGYFKHTVLYYGYYTNTTIQKNASLAPYNMQLAYIFTIGLYLAVCFLILLFSMAKSFHENFINPASYSGNAAKLLCSWDFNITNAQAVKLKQNSLNTQIKETLSERKQERLRLSVNQKIGGFFIHVAAWILSTGTAAACCTGVYYLCVNLESYKDTGTNELKNQAATLLVPVVVALINVVVPLFYALFGLVEKFKYPRHEIYVVIIRNILLKISIIGILCYYWLQVVAEAQWDCWESLVGQDIYRLVVIDFIFSLIGSFFGEFVRRIIGTRCLKQFGMPEFDIARNVLDLIYAQTLAWIGIFFSPLLPIIQIIKLFIIFYVKKVSLMMNCIPPRRAWRASQMTTIFILLLFFPSFAGVLCVIAVTVWRRQPSKLCGPFRSLETPYSSISNWIDTITFHENLRWLVWIYHNLIESVLFFFILTLIVLIISYLYWQIVQGRKTLVKLLQEQIANGGKDKAFLLQQLRKLQNMTGVPVSIPYKESYEKLQSTNRMQKLQFATETETCVPGSESAGVSDAMSLAMMARQQAELEGNSPAVKRSSPRDHGGSSDALAMVMMARQQAESEWELTRQSGGSEDALAMAMMARQQADSQREHRDNVATSDALVMAMRARQQAEMERGPLH
ncbi:transmembrane channel-like protein 5 isoform X1 [Ascaphus truei]|uniref:transmembrane channel-like protein 5 isoform X1 n=1 Tax=Ascaphus truei TaxID=8439 RepID=UPI003F5A27DA